MKEVVEGIAAQGGSVQPEIAFVNIHKSEEGDDDAGLQGEVS